MASTDPEFDKDIKKKYDLRRTDEKEKAIKEQLSRNREREAERQRIIEEQRAEEQRKEAEEKRIREEKEAEEKRIREERKRKEFFIEWAKANNHNPSYPPDDKLLLEFQKAEEKRIREEKEAEEKRIREEKEAEEKRIREEKEAEEKRIREEKEKGRRPWKYIFLWSFWLIFLFKCVFTLYGYLPDNGEKFEGFVFSFSPLSQADSKMAVLFIFMCLAAYLTPKLYKILNLKRFFIIKMCFIFGLLFIGFGHLEELKKEDIKKAETTTKEAKGHPEGEADSIKEQTEDLKQAEQLVQAGDKESAKEFYAKAADKGSPEAHFALAYRYIVSREEGIYHFSEAAKKGHEEALGYALDYLLFRADSLEYADPQGALDLYYQAKEANPDLNLYDEENKLRVMKMCAEAGDFDAEAFYKKYDLQPHSNGTLYHVWQIAEKASRGGRFGNPDPELVFQIVIRGSWVPFELESAVEETYANWKNGKAEEFNICDHITSSGGMGFCRNRVNVEDSNDRESKLVDIEEKLNG